MINTDELKKNLNNIAFKHLKINKIENKKLVSENKDIFASSSSQIYFNDEDINYLVEKYRINEDVEEVKNQLQNIISNAVILIGIYDNKPVKSATVILLDMLGDNCQFIGDLLLFINNHLISEFSGSCEYEGLIQLLFCNFAAIKALEDSNEISKKKIKDYNEGLIEKTSNSYQEISNSEDICIYGYVENILDISKDIEKIRKNIQMIHSKFHNLSKVCRTAENNLVPFKNRRREDYRYVLIGGILKIFCKLTSKKIDEVLVLRNDVGDVAVTAAYGVGIDFLYDVFEKANLTDEQRRRFRFPKDKNKIPQAFAKLIRASL